MNKKDAGYLGYLKTKDKFDEWRRTRTEIAKSKYKIKFCGNCSSPLPYERRMNKFCNSSCCAKSNNPKRKRQKTKSCEICLKSFVGESKICCSWKCLGVLKQRDYITRWLAGLETGGSWYSISVYVRRWMIDKYGEKCSQCGWCEINPSTGKIPLHADHIDGNPENHTPDNLRFLCPNCHSLTPTYGALNKGRGRKARYITPV